MAGIVGSHRSWETALQPSDGAKAVVVLVAEDELLVRMAATDILQEAG